MSRWRGSDFGRWATGEDAGRREGGCRLSRRPGGTGAAAVAMLLFVLIRHPFAPQVERGILEMTAIDSGTTLINVAAARR